MVGTGKGQLRLEIVREPWTAKERTTDGRNLFAEEQTAVEQWLKSEL